MFSMLAGAQTVHIIYRLKSFKHISYWKLKLFSDRPLEDLDIMVKQETERLKKIMEAEGKSEKVIEEVSR